MSGTGSLTVATWNMEWKVPGSHEAGIMVDRLYAHAPDIVCVTEGYAAALPVSGDVITSEADYGYPLIEGRRKVLLWSRSPWGDIDITGDPDLPTGRFAAAKTATPAGPVTVIGVCIPWRDAHVRSGRRDRQPWQDHLAYLKGLSRILTALPGPAILLGDFNQRIPRRYTPEPVHAALLHAMDDKFSVATAGLAGPDGRMAIDHIVHTGHFESDPATALSDTGPGGERLSDHFGLVVRLRAPDFVSSIATSAAR